MDKKTLEYIIKLRDQASVGFKKVGRTAKASFDKAKKAIFSVKTALIGMASYLIGRYVKAWVEAAARQEDAIQKVLAMAKSQGAAFVGLRKEVEAVTAALQAKTTYGDEAQMEAMAKMVATGADVTTAMKDMSLVMDLAAGAGMDLGTAGMYVARAMIGQPEMLARYVPAIRDLAKEERDWGTVKKILVGQFEGTAEAIAKTPFGLMKQIANLWGDIKENFGKFIAEWLANTGTLDAMKGILDGIATALGGVSKESEAGIKPSKSLGIAMYELALAMVTVGEGLDVVAQKMKEQWGWIEKVGQASISIMPMIKEMGILFKWLREKGDVGETVTVWAQLRDIFEDGILKLKYVQARLGPVASAMDDVAGATGRAGTAVKNFVYEMDPAIEKWRETAREMKLIPWGPDMEHAELAEQSFAKITDAASQWASVGRSLASSFATQFTDLIWSMGKGAKITFADIAASFGKMVTQMILQALALKALSFIPGFQFLAFAGKGGATRMQHGGIATAPVVHRNVVFGEAGPEAYVPLTAENIARVMKGAVNINIHTSDPNTYAEIVADNVGAQDSWYRDVILPAQERYDKR